jgi:hypothetical protein
MLKDIENQVRKVYIVRTIVHNCVRLGKYISYKYSCHFKTLDFEQITWYSSVVVKDKSNYSTLVVLMATTKAYLHIEGMSILSSDNIYK